VTWEILSNDEQRIVRWRVSDDPWINLQIIRPNSTEVREFGLTRDEIVRLHALLMQRTAKAAEP